MGATVVYRSSTARVLGACCVGFAALGIASLVGGGHWASLTSYGAVVAFVGLLGWAALWVPYVEVSDGGVLLRNVFRTVRLRWPSIRDVDGRYGLRLNTAHGAFSAWAATAPGGRSRARGEEGEAAMVVRHRLEELRRAGHLDSPRLEIENAERTMNVPVVVATAVLFVVAVVGLALR